MSKPLLDMELALLDKLVRQLPVASVTRLEPGTPAYRQLELVRELHKHYGAKMPPRVTRLWRDRVKPTPPLFKEMQQ